MFEFFLNFHGIGKAPQGASPAELRSWWDEDAFRTILDEFCSINLIARPAIRITFDDGNISDVEIALPELKSRGLTATFFICAGRVGKPGYLDAGGIKLLLDSGMEVGTHGMNHVDWRKTSDEGLNVEISSAKQTLEAVCGAPVTKASIPFGSYDRRVLARLRLEALKEVYSSDGGLATDQSWLKPRNSLDRYFSGKSVLDLIRERTSLSARFCQLVISQCKALR